MVFIDIEKAFDRVPREVVWRALRTLGVDAWLVTVIRLCLCAEGDGVW